MSADIIDHPGRRRLEQPERSAARYWMKHDVKAFAFETATADAEGAGALILLRGHYFITGSLPKTDAECSKVCRLSARKFARIRSWLFSFFDDEQKRAELDASIEETERIIENRRESGRKGGAGKALALARQMPKQNPRQSESQSQLEPESQSTTPPAPPPPSEPRAREAEALKAEALRSLPTSARAHPGWRGLSTWIAQKLGDGLEGVDIVVGIAQCLRSLKGEPPSTFGYFTAAIERARHARTAPLPHVPRPQPDHHELGACGEVIRKRLGDDEFAAWFSDSKLLGIDGNTVLISVPTRFKRERIVANYELLLLDAFKSIHPQAERIEITIEARP